MKATSDRWLQRYLKPVPIRAHGAYHLVAAIREAGGEPCVVVVPGPDTPAPAAAEAFAEIERVHRLLDHPMIPRVSARGTACRVPYLELACDAYMDGATVRHLLVDGGHKIPLASADGFATDLRLALSSAHQVVDPRTRKPVCLGRLSPANLLFSRTGRSFLVGFGRNFPIEGASGGPGAPPAIFQAPEVGVGGEASPEGDHVALLLLSRSLLPLVDLGTTVRHVLAGDARSADATLIEHLRWADTHLLGMPAGKRKSPAEAEAVRERIRAICGIRPSPEAFASHLRAILERPGPPPPSGDLDTAPALMVGLEASWIAGTDGVRYPLGQTARRIVMAFLERHRRAPGAVLTVAELLEAGWPDERVIPNAGSNRVYVALTHLRRMGLRDVIERSKGGYRLAPNAAFRLSA